MAEVMVKDKVVKEWLKQSHPIAVQKWLKQYYPIPAWEAPSGIGAVKHSLQKWRGLEPMVRESMGVNPCGWTIWGAGHTNILAGAGAADCALCQHYLDENLDMDGGAACARCPLYKSSGMSCAEEDAPYQSTRNSYPQSAAIMVAALEKTLQDMRDGVVRAGRTLQRKPQRNRFW